MGVPAHPFAGLASSLPRSFVAEDQSGMTFERSAFEFSKPFVVGGVLSSGLGGMALCAEPLKVVERMVVAGDDVVTLCAYPVASGGVCGGLAFAVCSASDLASDGRPVAGEPGGPGAGVPCHAGSRPSLYRRGLKWWRGKSWGTGSVTLSHRGYSSPGWGGSMRRHSST